MPHPIRGRFKRAQTQNQLSRKHLEMRLGLIRLPAGGAFSLDGLLFLLFSVAADAQLSAAPLGYVSLNSGRLTNS
jgi:hypothetical protein